MNESSVKSDIDMHMPKGRSLWADGFRQLRKRKLAMISLVIVSLYVAIVLFTYIVQWTDLEISITDWDQKTGAEYESPSSKNL